MIREIPPLRWRHLHTCPRCGGHNVSTISSGRWAPFDSIEVCSFCGVGYKERPSLRESNNIIETPQHCGRTESLNEIDYAISLARHGLTSDKCRWSQEFSRCSDLSCRFREALFRPHG
jgi:hypothetical protein